MYRLYHLNFIFTIVKSNNLFKKSMLHTFFNVKKLFFRLLYRIRGDFIKSALFYINAFLSGLFNSLLGAGGGILAVNSLKSRGLEQKKAQSTALTAMFILSVISCAVYLYGGYFSLSAALPYLPFGVAGAVAGAFLLKKTPDRISHKLFAVFMLWSGIRMVLK